MGSLSGSASHVAIFLVLPVPIVAEAAGNLLNFLAAGAVENGHNGAEAEINPLDNQSSGARGDKLCPCAKVSLDCTLRHGAVEGNYVEDMGAQRGMHYGRLTVGLEFRFDTGSRRRPAHETAPRVYESIVHNTPSPVPSPENCSRRSF